MAQLFGKDRTVIGRHIRNAVSDGEIDPTTMCAKFAHIVDNAAGSVKIEIYNLDVIIAVGYRVHFRRSSATKRMDRSSPQGVSPQNSGCVPTELNAAQAIARGIWYNCRQDFEVECFMAAKNAKTAKDAAKRGAAGRVVLVGTYRKGQLQKWRGWYNYPTIQSRGMRFVGLTSLMPKRWSRGDEHCCR